MNDARPRALLAREGVATRPRHWVSLGTACNNRCRFCLDGDRDRGLMLPEAELRVEIERGRRELGAEKLILSGGEASVHRSFTDLVRFAKASGYSWVQTITNGLRFSEPAFLAASLDAGLDEITFSLHGHTAELHDRLTGHPGAFRRIVRAIALAMRDRRPVISVDILLCRQNIAVLDRIIELCIGLGVREFDLLQVIPQGRAFDNGDDLFYEPAEHLSQLHRVLRLGRHPDYTLWTNRLPAQYLEGFEEFIQDPHKLHDEVRGRSSEYRAYLDEGVPMPCRQPERCAHCFMEPFCGFVDTLIAGMREESLALFSIGAVTEQDGCLPAALPFGCDEVAVSPADMDALAGIEVPRGMTLRLCMPSGTDPGGLSALGRAATVVAHSFEELGAWIEWVATAVDGSELEVELTRDAAAWLLEHRAAVSAVLERVVLSVPGRNHVRDVIARDLDDPARLFRELALPVRVRGLPACLAPGAVVLPALSSIGIELFEPATGRLALRPLTDAFIRQAYLVRSLRCGGCALAQRCAGLQINLARTLGLRRLTPLVASQETLLQSTTDVPRFTLKWEPSRPTGPAPLLPEAWRAWAQQRQAAPEFSRGTSHATLAPEAG